MEAKLDEVGSQKSFDKKAMFGVYSGIAAGLVWGLYPFIYKPLASVDILEVISHRIVWSVVFLLPVTIFYSKKTAELKAAFKSLKSAATLAICALVLAGWWLTYVYCLVSDRVLEAGLGYYLGPVLTASMGVVFLREKADVFSLAAVGVSFAGILYYAVETQGNFPVYGLLLGVFYSGYTILKRGLLKINSQVSVTIEFCMLFIPAVAYLIFKLTQGQLQSFIETTVLQNSLLIFIGIMNIIPMWCYSYASTNVPSVNMSFIQYISPTFNFLLAVFYYGEPFDAPSLVMFLLVWAGVAMFIAGRFLRSNSRQI